MSESFSDRRLAENEVIFKDRNKSVQKRFDEVNKIASEEGHEPVALDDDTPLYFYCECADENCKARINVTPKEYDKIHRNKKDFTVARGHNTGGIEDIVARTDDYWVVRKHEDPPNTEGKLNKTKVDNS